MTKSLTALAVFAALGLSSTPQIAHAQVPVVDSANLSQNIVSALHSVQSVMNQITQLSHEVQSLALQSQNLQNMPSGVSTTVLSHYTTQFSQLVSAMQSINGIAKDVATLTATFNSTFPSSSLAQGPLSNANVMTQLTGWLTQSRSVFQGAYSAQAQVMKTLSADSANVQTLLQASGSSKGALDALQAGNQLSGQIAGQLMKLNQQMAAINQAQVNWMAQQSQMLAHSQKNGSDGMTGYTTKSTATADLTYTRFH